MAVHLYIIDRQGNELFRLGAIESDKFDALIKISKQEKFSCAAYLDFVGDTILNQKQISMLKEDIEALQLSNIINMQDISLVLMAIAEAQKSGVYYLAFYGE